MTRRWILACLAPVVSLGAIDQETSLAAARKFQRLAAGEVASGDTVELSQDEMNSFLRYHPAASVPEGIREPEMQFREGGVVIRAEVDLEKAGEQSQDLSALMRLLLRGKRRIALDMDFAGNEGYGSAKLVSIVIDSVELSGSALQWFLESFAPPELAPYATGEATALQPGVDAIRLEPGRAMIVAK